MRDPVLDQRLESCKKLLEYWQRFHVYLREAATGRKFSPTDEANFLKVKSEIAILHDSFFDSIESENRAVTATAQSVISIVEQCILLRQMAKTSPAELKKLEIEWHEAYLLINETIGILQEKIDKFAKVNRTQYNMKRYYQTISTWIMRILRNQRFHFALVMIALIMFLIVLPMMGIGNFWPTLYKLEPTRPVYVAVQNALRKTVMKNLGYVDLNAFIDHDRGDMPGGYNPTTAWQAGEETQIRAGMFVKKYPNVEPLDLTKDVQKRTEEKLFKYEITGGKVVVYYGLFKANNEAEKLVAQIKKWRDSIPPTSDAANGEKSYSYARVLNIFFVVYSDRPDSVEKVVNAIQPAKK